MTVNGKDIQGVGASSRGYNMQLVSGKPFFPLDPRPDEIEIEDIAHSLSMQCRFGGHCNFFYSVAQHSVLVSYIVDQDFALDGLLHDATEAYCGDIIKPIKHVLPDVKTIEARIYDALAERFALRNPLPHDVHHADMVALATERRDLMAEADGVDWGLELPDPLDSVIAPWPPEHARKQFMARYREITA